MTRAIRPRGTGRTRRQASTALHLGVALWLVFYIVYTPIHLYGTPHSHDEDLDASSSRAVCRSDSVEVDGPEGGAHHSPHSAAQHQFKGTQTTRAAVVALLAVPTVTRVLRHEVPAPFQGFVFSGLSPPELSRCWQFLFRTALPVRAPSLLS